MSEILNVSHQYRCIFIHVPKAAGTSIKQALDLPGGGHWTWYYYATYHPELWREYTSFAVVRNPWDRAVSAYRHAKMKHSHWHNEKLGLHPDYELLLDKSFEECLDILLRERERLQHASWAAQATQVAAPKSQGGAVMVDRLLRHETIDHDFRELCGELGAGPFALLTINRSKRSRDYREYYNERTRKVIEQVYAADLETFGYSF
jgi:hypothetical protein